MKRLFLWKMPVIIITVLFTTAAFASTPPDAVQKTQVINKAYRMQIPFIENKGQVENIDVSFYAKTFGGMLFVGKDGTLTYSFASGDKEGVVIKEILTDNKVTVKGLEPSPTAVNYFKGNDQSKWKTNIPSYNSISLGEVYKGVELTLKAYGKNVEKLFTVLPSADPGAIKVTLQGAKELKVNDKGELEVLTDHGPITFTKPRAYQEIEGKKVEVEVAYKIEESAVRSQKSEFEPLSLSPEPLPFSYNFQVASYDKTRSLIIDPLLASTFIGGGNDELGYSLALDKSGNVYVTGHALSGFPITPGAYDESHNGNYDVFVSKLDSNLSTLLASTFIGGGVGMTAILLPLMEAVMCM